MINLLVTGMTGMVVATFLSILLYLSMENSYERKMDTITALLADNLSPALLFGDNSAAHEALVTFRTVPEVQRVEVFDSSGHTFAQYAKSGELPNSSHEYDYANYPSGFHFGSMAFIKVFPITTGANKTEHVGSILVRMNMQPAYQQLGFEIGALFLLTILSFLFNSKLLNLFQRSITQPLIDLTGVMNRVRHGNDYSLRACSESSGEIGELANTFNQMLNELLQRENALKQELLERQHVEHQLTGSNNRFETVLKTLPDLMFEVDANGRYLNVWGGKVDSLIAPKNEMIGRTANELLPPEAANIFMASIEEANTCGYSQGRQISLALLQGVRWFELSVAKQLPDAAGAGCFVVLSRDVTERKLSEDKIEHLAYYDTLTGLPNRRLLMDRLKQALLIGARNDSRGALLFIDLDNFKTLNDTLGHDMGDLLLQQAAIRITSCLRECDTVARLGGDEFVVLLENLNKGALDAAAQTESVGKKIIFALVQPYQLGSHKYSGTPSIGATLISDHQLKVDELLKQADIAMYQAKSDGRNALRFFDPKMQQSINARATLEEELHQAVANQEFRLYYQLQLDKSGHPLGAETLVRWQHPQRGVVSPAEFIPLAEECGLIIPIGQWVLETACAQLKAWEQTALTRDLVLAVNVSATQFRQAGFVEQVHATILRHALDPSRLKLELTESLLLNDVEEIIVTMNDLKKIGVKFSLDDFGTGYSSLQYLKQLPLDQLKIDQSFVRDLVSSHSEKIIVRTIIAMAKSLNFDVIAEGVETEDQRQILLNNGCNNYQGYLFSKPVPIEQFEVLLADHGKVYSDSADN